MYLRAAFILILIISVCAWPLWVTCVISLGALVLFKGFYELLPIFFLNDALYGTPLDRFWSFPFCMTLMATILVLVSVFLRRSLFDAARVYPHM